MLSRMWESGSSPLAWVEFSVHCWFIGLDRTLMSWTPTLRAARIDCALTLTGRPMQGLLRVPWTRPSCGLIGPSVFWLP